MKGHPIVAAVLAFIGAGFVVGGTHALINQARGHDVKAGPDGVDAAVGVANLVVSVYVAYRFYRRYK